MHIVNLMIRICYSWTLRSQTARRRRRATERLWLLRKVCNGRFRRLEINQWKEKNELEKTPGRVTFVVPSRADLRWVAHSPSMESRTETSPNFGKTNIVSQFTFHLIFVLLQLLCRFSMYIVISSKCLQFGLKIEIERSKFGADLQKSCIPDTSDISYLC